MGLPAARHGGRVVGALDLALPEFPRWNGMEWKEGRKGRRSDDGLTGWLAGWLVRWRRIDWRLRRRRQQRSRALCRLTQARETNRSIA